MLTFLALYPMESISLNSFVLLEHLATLLNSPFFGSGIIQFYVLLNPYLCFIPFLCFDLYVFGDDALISWVY